jgi:regulator of sirC expression with transglutaminase-like and TPR domain
MLRNLKGIYAQTDHPRALRIQERLIQLLPGAPAELRDLALLYACNNKPILAHRTFEQLVRQHPTMGETDFIQERARHAAREAALVN